MSEWSGMLKDLFRQIDDGSITLQELQAFIEHRNPFEVVGSVKGWENFYRETFGIECDFSNLQIPKKRKGFDRLIIVAQGMTPQKLFDKCKELFLCWRWTDKNLDEMVNSERTSKNGAYAVWFRNRVEADEGLKNLSANDLEKRRIPGITLEERLLLELKYFKETGRHLDVERITLCSGSRDSVVGAVPGVGWCGGKLCIDWYDPARCYDGLGSRRAVL
jgi:hypothetical protein